MTSLSELLDIPLARGRTSKLQASAKRSIVPGDIEALRNPPQLEQVEPIQQLRHQHHMLARLLAEGRSTTESAEITGYSVTYISRLQTQDRAFKELIKYYKEQVHEAFVNVHERLAGLGLNTVEELQERLADKPASFTHRELMELAELCFDRSGYGPTSTNKSVVALLTGDDIARLKSEISSRSLGTVQQLSPSDLSATSEGRTIELSLQANSIEGSEGSRSDVSEKSGQSTPKDLP